MFSKANKASGKPASSTSSASGSARPVERPKSSGVPSIISADLNIVGDLTSHGDLQVDGSVDGDINSRTLTIGENARVNGAVSADKMRICGTVTGQLKAESVVLAKTAKVLGDIIHESLEIEAGAFIEGSIRRIGSEKPHIAQNLESVSSAPEPPPANGAGNAQPSQAKPLAG